MMASDVFDQIEATFDEISYGLMKTILDKSIMKTEMYVQQKFCSLDH